MNVRRRLAVLWTAGACSLGARAQEFPGLPGLTDRTSAGALEVSGFGPQEILGDLLEHEPDLTELSGLAHSTRTPGLLWAIDDGRERLYAIHYGTEDGVPVRTDSYKVKGGDEHDWEDLAAFQVGPKHYLMIADVGTNSSGAKKRKRKKREVGKLLVLEEPEPGATPEATKARVAWTISFDLPCRKKNDIEAVAVDWSRGQVLLVKKRETGRPLLVLNVEGELDQHFDVEDEDWSEVLLPELAEWEADGEHDPGNQYQTAARLSATALDVFERQAVLLTYRHAYLYERAEAEDWRAAFARAPRQVQLPYSVELPDRPEPLVLPSGSRSLHQREALCFDREGRGLFIASEAASGEALLARVSR